MLIMYLQANVHNIKQGFIQNQLLLVICEERIFNVN